MAKRQTFFNTPWNERGAAERILVISAVIGSTIGGIVLVRRSITAIKERRKNKATETYEKAFQDKGQKLSYPLSQYYMFADQLFTAMNSYWYNPFTWGTTLTEIAGVMYKMKNDYDVLQLNKAFGKRDGYSLAEWISDEMSEDDQKTYVNNILAKKGIKFRY